MFLYFFYLQLWGAALPLNTPGTPCILDPDSRVGVCGDWLSGGSLQAAAVSGITLARQIAGRGRAGRIMTGLGWAVVRAGRGMLLRQDGNGLAAAVAGLLPGLRRGCGTCRMSALAVKCGPHKFRMLECLNGPARCGYPCS